MKKTIATFLASLVLSAFTCGQTAENPSSIINPDIYLKTSPPSAAQNQAEIDAYVRTFIYTYDKEMCAHDRANDACVQRWTVLL